MNQLGKFTEGRCFKWSPEKGVGGDTGAVKWLTGKGLANGKKEPAASKEHTALWFKKVSDSDVI